MVTFLKSFPPLILFEHVAISDRLEFKRGLNEKYRSTVQQLNGQHSSISIKSKVSAISSSAVKIQCLRLGPIGEDEVEVGVFSTKRWDSRNRADLIESATPYHDAQVFGPYRVSNLLRLTFLTSKLEDYTTGPQHLIFIHSDLILRSSKIV